MRRADRRALRWRRGGGEAGWAAEPCESDSHTAGAAAAASGRVDAAVASARAWRAANCRVWRRGGMVHQESNESLLLGSQ